MNIARIIIFSSDVPRLAGFYRTMFGFTLVGKPDADWVELTSGDGSNLAIHGTARNTRAKADTGIKIVFGAKRVRATRARLIRLGATMGEVREFTGITMCDGKDPDGNAFQISSRGM